MRIPKGLTLVVAATTFAFAAPGNAAGPRLHGDRLDQGDRPAGLLSGLGQRGSQPRALRAARRAFQAVAPRASTPRLTGALGVAWEPAGDGQADTRTTRRAARTGAIHERSGARKRTATRP